MKTEVKSLPKSQYELTVELTVAEMQDYLNKAVEKLSREVKVEGFRPGKATFEVLKNKIGELSIWEEAGYIAINKTLDQAISENIKEPLVGRPEISVTKLAPGNPFEYKAVVSILPAVTLGEYKDLKIKIDKVSIADDETDKVIEDLREMRVKEYVVDRPAADGDKLTVDIQMFLDKVPLEGGQGKDTAVIIGKGYVVPGFDKKLLGVKKDEVREFELPYPGEHFQKNLAGKLVQFKVKIKEVYSRELPAVDDAFAAAFGLKSVEELKNNIKASLASDKEEKARQKAEIQMLDKIIGKTKFGDIPEVLIKNEGETMLNELAHNLEHQGAKLEDYLKSLNRTREQMLLDLMPDAAKRVKSALVIRAIASAEKITVAKEEVEREVQAVLKHYAGSREVTERAGSHEYEHYVENALTNRKVMDKLFGWNMVEG